MEQHENGASPPDDGLAAFQAILHEALQPFGQQIAELKAALAALEKRTPDAQALVDKAVAVLGPALSKQINEKMEGLAAGETNGRRAETGPGETSSKEPAVPDKPSSLSAKVTDIVDVVSAVAEVVLAKFYPLYTDYRKEARLDRQEARADKMLDTNPFMIADTMRASNSPLLPMYTAAFAPTPQQVADAQIRLATDATVIGLRARDVAHSVLREDRLRQRETPSPNSPNSSGSPTSTSPQSPMPTNAGVTMTSEKGNSNQPRLTLRAVMG